jgi:hypothetical protein
MANPATSTDVENRWRSLTPDEVVIVETLLDDAWAMLRRRRPTLEADIAASTVSEADAVRILANMVLRVMKNPEGKRSEQIDDYSYTRDNTLSSGELYVTAEELADLTPEGYRRSKSVRLVAHGDS